MSRPLGAAHIERENFAAPQQKQRTRSLWDSPGAGGGSGLTMPGPTHQCEEPGKASLRRAHGPGDRLDGPCVPEVSPDTGSIECTGSRLASRSRESATRANAARDCAVGLQPRIRLAQPRDLPAQLVDQGKALAPVGHAAALAPLLASTVLSPRQQDTKHHAEEEAE